MPPKPYLLSYSKSLKSLKHFSEKELLQELCNPHSLNIKQLKKSLEQFSQILLQSQIITKQRFNQINQIISKPKSQLLQLTEQQIINLVKWEIAAEFIINYVHEIDSDKILQKENHEQINFLTPNQNNQSSQKLSYFADIYQNVLKYLFPISQKGKYLFSNEKQSTQNNLLLKKQYKYVSFQILASILDLILQLKLQKSQSGNMLQLKSSKNQKIFYFIDIAEIFERGDLWNQFSKTYKSNQQNQAKITSNNNLLKTLYFGLTIESLQFQSISASIKFISDLLQLLFDQNEKNESYITNQQIRMMKEKYHFVTIANLNRILYFLRVLKGSVFSRTNNNGIQNNSGISSPHESQNIINSKRSLLSKAINSSKKFEIDQQSDHNFQNNINAETEYSFLNSLQQKLEKSLENQCLKNRQFKFLIQKINSQYEPLNQIVMLKNISCGSDYISNFTIKKSKHMQFSQEQKKLFFAFMASQLKNFYKSIEFDKNVLYQHCKQTFVKFQRRKKIENHFRNSQNVNVKVEVMEEFRKNLSFGLGLIKQTNKNIQLKSKKMISMFSHKIIEKQKSSKSLQKQLMFLPSLRPKINLQVQNRLKLKQMKADSNQKKVTKQNQHSSYIEKNKSLSQQKHTTLMQQGAKIVSLKKFSQSNIASKNKFQKRKSFSLPSKIKINANYVLNGRVDNMKNYQNAINSIISRKFSYDMLICKRQNEDQFNKINLDNFKSTEKAAFLNQNNKKRVSMLNQTKKSKHMENFRNQKQILEANNKQATNQFVNKQKSLQQKGNFIQNSIQSFLFAGLPKQSKRNNQNSKRKSLILKNSSERLSTNEKNQGQHNMHELQNQKIEDIYSLNVQKNEPHLGKMLISSINAIIQNCKINGKNNIHNRKLKLGNRSNDKRLIGNNSIEKHKIQIQEIKQEQSKFQNLQFQDASLTLTFLQNYFRTFIQCIKHQLFLQDKYLFYPELQKIGAKNNFHQPFIFGNLVFSVVRKQIFTNKTKKKQAKDNNWSTFRYFVQLNQKIQVIQIQQKPLMTHNSNEQVLNYLKDKFSHPFRDYNLTSSYHKNYAFKMIGDLGGNLSYYKIKPIILEQLKQRKQIQKYYQNSQIKKKDQQNYFAPSYFQNNQICQIIGIQKQKHSVQNIELYVTKTFVRKNQLNQIQKFVNKFFFGPMNQYIRDWIVVPPNNHQSFKNDTEQANINGNQILKEQSKLYHIYFLNRNYEKKSKFRHLIKKLEVKYPSFSYKEYLQTAFYLSNQQKIFSQSVQLLQYLCKSLIINKKYVLFNIKILKIHREKTDQVHLLIQQKNSNFGDHKLVFFVFPLNIKSQKSKREKLKLKQDQNGNNMKYYKRTSCKQFFHQDYSKLMQNMKKYHSLKDVCNHLIRQNLLEVNDWGDTMFNKFVLTHPHIKIIKKIYFSCKEENTEQKRQSIFSKKESFNSSQKLSFFHKEKIKFIFATMKIFIFDKNNLVIGIVQISNQSFLFTCLFQELNQKAPRIKCRPLSKSYIGLNQIKSDNKYSKNCHASKRKIVQRNIFNFTINNFLNSEVSLKNDKNINTAKSVNSTKKIFKTEKTLMTEQQNMTEIKQKFMSIFKYLTQLTLTPAKSAQNQSHRKRLSIDSYLSRYSLSIKIEDQPIRVMETKYYWPDIIPESKQKCINFRLKDDSLLLIKFNKESYYTRKSNKIKIQYFQNYLKIVQQNKLKNKGNVMNDMIRKNDKFNYYRAYTQFVQDLEKFYFTFSISKNLLLKIKLGITPHGTYSISVIDIEIQNILQCQDTQRQQIEKIKQFINFQIDPQDLSVFRIPSIKLNKKNLNTKKFRRRLHYLIDQELQSILRKF